jgi:hypothetical protein
MIVVTPQSLRSTRGFACAALWIAVVLPCTLSAWLVARYGVDVPFWDEWSLADILQQFHNGTLTASALVSQHNEHRMLMPRALQLAVALTVAWDTRILMWLTQGVLIGMLAICVVLWRRSVDSRGPRAVLSLALLSLLLLSPAQHQNLLWGFQICFYFPAACLLAIVLIASPRGPALGPALVSLVILSTAATLSVVPGLLLWPLGAIAVIFAHGLPSRTTARAWCAAAAACALVVGLYFFSYEPPPHSPSVLAALRHPLMLSSGIAVSVGAPLSFNPAPVTSAALVGAGLIGMLLWLLFRVWNARADASLVARSAPWIVMGTFGLLCGMAIAVGRIGYGLQALLEPRYSAFTMWVPIAVVLLAATLHDRAGTPASWAEWIACCTAVVVCYALSLPHHFEAIRRAHRERLQGRAVYLFAEAAATGAPMVPLWLDWATIKQLLAQIEQAGFRPRRPPTPAWVDTEELRESCGAGIAEFEVAIGPRIMAGGWVFLPTKRRSADAVLVTVGPGRQIVALQPPLAGRGDIGERFATDEALVTGWVIDIQPGVSLGDLEFWALDSETVRAYRLCQSSHGG